MAAFMFCLPMSRARAASGIRGTANAIYQNLAFIEQFNPDYVLILSGDHIYKMDYNAMLAVPHRQQGRLHHRRARRALGGRPAASAS